MPKIKILPLHEAQKIAAGEVVERPANIVKELIENALDAAATTISVHIEDGGKKLIRVIDTGCGMDVQDAQLCFDKHATSKITHVDALEHINTFGFRGEALASIAAVSKITLITKERDTTEGTKVTVEQNTVIDTQPVSANTGTDIAVHDLFYNIPARKKFLKVRDTEWRHILHLVQAFCLDYPEIHFKLFSDGKQIINCPATQNIRARCAQVWDQHISSDMLTIEAHREDNTFSILGIITNHQQFRYDRNTIFFFVNKRWVKDFKLSNALLKGYQNVLPHGKYPTACISITVDPTLVDINIHPRKEEVKFMHPRLIEQLIQQTVKQALEIHISANLNPKVMNTADMAISTPSTSFFSSHPSRSFTPYNFDPSTSDFAYPSVPARQASSDKPLSATPGMAERMDGELSSVGMTNTKENTHAFAMPDTLLDTQDMRNEMELQKTLGMQEELGQALRQGSEQALRQGSEQALRQGSGQALRQGSGQASLLE
ncbi:MAG: DNA mismatch repair endonuclease MutL [bacterium]|nr:DNA mismatch repair endonuclease MutL [bacterium]